jgi:hypothetical protein
MRSYPTMREQSTSAVFIRERGGPDYQPWTDSRSGKPRDLQAKAPCASCNNKPVKLTKTKKAALSAGSMKLALIVNGAFFWTPSHDQ